MNVYPVIMCGGSGTRLWPASRPSRPKQFVPLVGDKTLFAQTVDRLDGIQGYRQLIIVTGSVHARLISPIIAERENTVVLLEPEGRDSAPAIAVATQWILNHDPDGIAAVVASDHYIPDKDGFCEAINKCALAAADGRIVTLGIVPTNPTSAYGYIKPQIAEGSHEKGSVLPVDRFVEKPDEDTAREYIEEGFLWNSGNFVFSASTMRNELMALHADVMDAGTKAVASACAAEFGHQLDESFRTAPKISIDYAVMEKTDKASVLPAPLTWSDLGAWDAVKAVSHGDDSGNTINGDVFVEDTTDCYLSASPGQVLATVGVQDIAVVADEDAILVCSLDKAQAVKKIVQQLEDYGHPHIDIPDRNKKDLQWYKDRYNQWLHTAALPLWWSHGADHDGWGFHESCAQSGVETGADRRARVQARQVYAFAEAGRMGWPGPWKTAVAHGLKGLGDVFQRPDGLIRSLVSADGTPLDDTAVLYNQAFFLLALASASNITQDTEKRALAILSRIENDFIHENGGFRERSGISFQSNPHMHLLEAALAWIEQSDGEHWWDLANRIANLCVEKFIDGDSGFLREFFDQNWSPASGHDGTVVEPGHQFEWAWLLVRYAKLADNERYIETAKRLYQAGNAGVDKARQVAVDSMDDTLTPVTEQARLWPQTERLKAALILSDFSSDRDRTILLNDARQAAASLQRYLETPINGFWWDKMFADSSFMDEPASGSSFYHIVAAISQLNISVR